MEEWNDTLNLGMREIFPWKGGNLVSVFQLLRETFIINHCRIWAIEPH